MMLRVPAVLAFAKIGEPTVLPLIEVFASATSIAASICGDRNRRSPGVSCAPDKLADRIRMRAAEALGGIGDARALPALEGILKPGAPAR
jgi:HEAT repeat protein